MHLDFGALAMGGARQRSQLELLRAKKEREKEREDSARAGSAIAHLAS